MSDPSSEVGKLESAALARKERLAKLRAAKEQKSGLGGANDTDENSKLPRSVDLLMVFSFCT